MLLYLDNIRGFSNQVIDLNDVNFLVGENSTGKSTVLAILHFFSETNFDSFPSFKSRFADFGPFQEIVGDGDYFQIGFYSEVKGGFSNIEGHFLLRFREKDGFPIVDRLSWMIDGAIVRIELIKQVMNFSYGSINSAKLGDVSNFQLIDLAETRQTKSVTTFNKYFSKTDGPISLLNLSLIWSFYSSINLPKKIAEAFGVSKKWKRKYEILSESIWIDPIRSKPQRIYEPEKIEFSPEGGHVPSLLRDLLASGKANSDAMISRIEFYGKKSGLFDKIIIDQYRKTNDSPFSINFKLRGKVMKITNIGYGVSQILPILTEVVRHDSGVYLIQQPEVHLHPKSQAFFGEFIFSEFIEGKKKFLIETHSDFIIDRFRSELRRHKNKKLIEKTNVLFFERVNGHNKVTKIPLDANADYSTDQPKAFREFFLREQMLNLGME